MRKAPAFIFANSVSKIFHLGRRNNDRCRAEQIKKANRVEFETSAEARRAGYRGCKFCFHDESDRVK